MRVRAHAMSFLTRTVRLAGHFLESADQQAESILRSAGPKQASAAPTRSHATDDGVAAQLDFSTQRYVSRRERGLIESSSSASHSNADLPAVSTDVGVSASGGDNTMPHAAASAADDRSSDDVGGPSVSPLDSHSSDGAPYGVAAGRALGQSTSAPISMDAIAMPSLTSVNASAAPPRHQDERGHGRARD